MLNDHRYPIRLEQSIRTRNHFLTDFQPASHEDQIAYYQMVAEGYAMKRNVKISQALRGDLFRDIVRN